MQFEYLWQEGRGETIMLQGLWCNEQNEINNYSTNEDYALNSSFLILFLFTGAK